MLEKITKFFSKERSSNIEVKGVAPYSPYAALFAPYVGNTFPFATTNVKWMQYYATVAPVGDAVNKIADKASPIDIMLFAPDKVEAELPVTEHPFLKLLNRPNPYQTRQQFIKEFLVHKNATGNNYLRIVGGISADKKRFVSEPVEMYNLRPDFITGITPDPLDGRALYYQYTEPNGGIRTFYRTEMRGVNGNLVDAYVEPNGASQLYVFKNLSSRHWTGYYNLYGDSPLQAAEIQIGQFFEAAVYNYFLIVNGLSARKLISLDSKEIFTQAQKDSLKRFIDENFSGAVNSGKTLVSPIPLKVEDLQIAIKDMDFGGLYDRAERTTYKALNIPLPIISDEHTSMNNMDISMLMFFDDAVLPSLSDFCNNLFTFPFYDRYKDAKQFLKLGYNPNSIGALQPRIAEVVKVQKEAGVATINELREYLGLSRVNSEGCDDIYLDGKLVSIGTDTNLRDTIGIDAPDTTDKDGQKKQLEQFMRESKTADGKPMYSEESIRILSS